MNKPEIPPQNDVAGPRPRHTTTQVMVGNVAVGGGAPIVVQSMTNTDTADVEGTIAQVAALPDEALRLRAERSSGFLEQRHFFRVERPDNVKSCPVLKFPKGYRVHWTAVEVWRDHRLQWLYSDFT